MNNVLSDYANVFIPLGISIIAAVGTFWATFAIYREKVNNISSGFNEFKASINKDINDLKNEIKELRNKSIKNESLDNLIFSMSLYLRDLSLPELGFKYDEIDKDDPEFKQ